MYSYERELMVPEATIPLKRNRWAEVLSRVLAPLHTTVAATLLAALVPETESRLATLGLVVGLFGGAVVLVIGVMRLVGGPDYATRRRAVPAVLAAEAAALVIGYFLELPREVFAAFAAYFVVGVVALAGARWNISAHGLMAGALTGLLLGWIPAVGLAALVVLVALAGARVVLGQHTIAQAGAGAIVGCGVGLLAGVVGL